jgi:hypothetical protein
VTTALKALPLLAIAVFGLLHFDAQRCLVPFVPPASRCSPPPARASR